MKSSAQQRQTSPAFKKGEGKEVHWFSIRETLSIAFKFSGFILWIFILLLALLEFKRYYNIDVLPNYDSSVDDVYGIIKGTLSGFFGEED